MHTPATLCMALSRFLRSLGHCYAHWEFMVDGLDNLSVTRIRSKLPNIWFFCVLAQHGEPGIHLVICTLLDSKVVDYVFKFDFTDKLDQ